MSDVNHPHGTNGLGGGNPKLDFSYFLNPPPIYEELPDGGNSDNGPSEDEFAEDELSVIDVPISSQCHEGGACGGGGGESGGQPSSSSSSGSHHRYHPNSISSRNPNPKSRVQSLNRRRTSSRNTSTGPGSGPQSPGGFKPPSQRYEYEVGTCLTLLSFSRIILPLVHVHRTHVRILVSITVLGLQNEFSKYIQFY